MFNLLHKMKKMLSVVAFTAIPAMGCGQAQVVGGTFRTASRDQGILLGDVTGITGTYEDGLCTDPATGTKRIGATWSMGAVPTQAPEPAVIQNDSGCILNLTGVAVLDSAGMLQLATAAGALPLPAFFLSQPVQFEYTDSGTGDVVQFYVNASIAPADFAERFSIQVLYSEAAAPVSSLRVQHTYIISTISEATVSRVPAPSNTLDLSNMTVILDAQNNVAAVSNEPLFTLGQTPGDGYTITGGACPTTLAAAMAAWGDAKVAGTSVAIDTALTASAFGVVAGQPFMPPMERCMIIANCEELSNVCSFQLFDVIFE